MSVQAECLEVRAALVGDRDRAAVPEVWGRVAAQLVRAEGQVGEIRAVVVRDVPLVVVADVLAAVRREEVLGEPGDAASGK